jgi:hypothetical protein
MTTFARSSSTLIPCPRCAYHSLESDYLLTPLATLTGMWFIIIGASLPTTYVTVGPYLSSTIAGNGSSKDRHLWNQFWHLAMPMRLPHDSQHPLLYPAIPTELPSTTRTKINPRRPNLLMVARKSCLLNFLQFYTKFMWAFS